jgi:hypothetical protein
MRFASRHPTGGSLSANSAMWPGMNDVLCGLVTEEETHNAWAKSPTLQVCENWWKRQTA